MKTPIYDFIKKYSKTDIRPHMPGHKGQVPIDDDFLKNAYTADITEIEGADSLFEADGIIAESERNASKLFGTAGTFYSAGGSTLCIQTMLYLTKLEGRKIFAMRNVHRSFLNAAALLGLDVEWIFSHDSMGILTGKVPLETVEKMLSECKTPAAVYVTSPDYLGNIADIKNLAEICHKYNARLVVDNAHGAHLAFMPENRHPIALGADLCCDSAHKMLPALTGAAYVHTSDSRFVPLIKNAMSVFGSSSPSYLILASLDLCNDYIENKISRDIEIILPVIESVKNNLSRYYKISSDDPFHFTIYADESNITGTAIADFLVKNNVFPEYSDKSVIVLLLSPVTRAENLRMLEDYLLDFAVLNDCHYVAKNTDIPTFLPLKKSLDIRTAAFSPYKTVPVEQAIGEVAASVSVPCPPAVPIAVCGEVIDENTVEIFKYYGICYVNIVK